MKIDWLKPLLGHPGELYRQPLSVDPSGAAYTLEDGALRHVPREEHTAEGAVTITDLPVAHPLWALPRAI